MQRHRASAACGTSRLGGAYQRVEPCRRPVHRRRQIVCVQPQAAADPVRAVPRRHRALPWLGGSRAHAVRRERVGGRQAACVI